MQLCINIAILHKLENEDLLSSDHGQKGLKQLFVKCSTLGLAQEIKE